MELILIPLVGGALSLGVIGSGCVPGGSLGSLFADGAGAVFPPSSPDQMEPHFSEMATSRGVHTDDLIIIETFASNLLPPNEPQS